MKSTYHTVPRYVVFSTPLQLKYHPSWLSLTAYSPNIHQLYISGSITGLEGQAYLTSQHSNIDFIQGVLTAC